MFNLSENSTILKGQRNINKIERRWKNQPYTAERRGLGVHGNGGEGEWSLDGSLVISCQLKAERSCGEGSGWGLKRWRYDLTKSTYWPHREKIVRMRMNQLYSFLRVMGGQGMHSLSSTSFPFHSIPSVTEVAKY